MKTFKAFGKPEELSDVPNKPKKRQHWGYHLLVDASYCNEDIDNPSAVKSFLKELVQKIKMTPIGEPIVVKVDSPEGRGISAMQLITTSTITFHGDDKDWCVYLDVFACKPYDPKIALELFNDYFEPEHLGYKFIYRDAGSWPK